MRSQEQARQPWLDGELVSLQTGVHSNPTADAGAASAVMEDDALAARQHSASAELAALLEDMDELARVLGEESERFRALVQGAMKVHLVSIVAVLMHNRTRLHKK